MPMTIEFWMKAAPLIAVAGNHPFVVEMVDGTLHLDNFRYYVMQNALFLDDFADCLRTLSLKSGIDEADSNRLEAFAVGVEESKHSLHNSFFQHWAISTEITEQMPHTFLYTEYMKRIVATRSLAEGLAVLLPYYWLYAHVGVSMLKLRTQLGHGTTRLPQYDAFIEKYGSDDFANESKEYMIITDTACEAADECILQEMDKHFIMACKYEGMLWDQAVSLMAWPDKHGSDESD